MCSNKQQHPSIYNAFFSTQENSRISYISTIVGTSSAWSFLTFQISDSKCTSTSTYDFNCLHFSMHTTSNQQEWTADAVRNRTKVCFAPPAFHHDFVYEHLRPIAQYALVIRTVRMMIWYHRNTKCPTSSSMNSKLMTVYISCSKSVLEVQSKHEMQMLVYISQKKAIFKHRCLQ